MTAPKAELLDVFSAPSVMKMAKKVSDGASLARRIRYDMASHQVETCVPSIYEVDSDRVIQKLENFCIT